MNLQVSLFEGEVSNFKWRPMSYPFSFFLFLKLRSNFVMTVLCVRQDTKDIVPRHKHAFATTEAKELRHLTWKYTKWIQCPFGCSLPFSLLRLSTSFSLVQKKKEKQKKKKNRKSPHLSYCLFKLACLPQSIPSTVSVRGLKACLVHCFTSEMVCVFVSSRSPGEWKERQSGAVGVGQHMEFMTSVKGDSTCFLWWWGSGGFWEGRRKC